MSDKTDEDDAAAKQGVNGDLGAAKDLIDGLKGSDLKDQPKSDADADPLKADLEDEIDAAMEDINASRIRAADRRIRNIKKKLKAGLKDKDTALPPIIAKLDAAAKGKRKITSVAVQPSSTMDEYLKKLLIAMLIATETYGPIDLPMVEPGPLVRAGDARRSSTVPPIEPMRSVASTAESLDVLVGKVAGQLASRLANGSAPVQG